MSKNKNKNVSPVVVSSVPVVVEEAVASLSDVLGEVSSETSLETVSETVLSEVLSEEAPSAVSLVQETVSVEVPNVFLSKFQNWLTNTTTRAANGGLTSNGKKLGRKVTKTTRVQSLIKLRGNSFWNVGHRGRPPLGAATYSIEIPLTMTVLPETKFLVDLSTGSWSILVEEVQQESLAA